MALAESPPQALLSGKNTHCYELFLTSTNLLKVNKTNPFSKHSSMNIGTTEAAPHIHKSGNFDTAEFTQTNRKVLTWEFPFKYHSQNSDPL